MKRLTGKIDPSRILAQDVPRPASGLIARIEALGCDTSLISDAMDHLGLSGTLPASLYRPTLPGAAIAGPATTVRNRANRGAATPRELAISNRNGMAEMEAHNLANPGDILIIEGVAGLSNMGGISSMIAKRHGILGAIVQGGVRDISHAQEVGFPFWSTEVSPVTGKWRLQTVEINGPVQISGVGIHPGDLIVADDTGICVIPIARAEDVLAVAEAQFALEAVRMDAIAAGAHVADLPKKAAK